VTPTFTVLIGSIGRPALRQALDSIARQARVPGDQVIVCFDAFEQSAEDLAARCALVESYGEGFIAITHDAGYHWLGVEQINHALRTVPITGSHVCTIGDDDVFVDGAYARLRPLCAIDPDRAVLYRFLAPWRELLWDRPRMQMSRISGCCIAAPRAAVGLMSTRQYVEHDYDWMIDVLQTSGRYPLWVDDVLVIARPDVRGDDVAHRGLLRCWRCQDWRFLEDVNAADPTCPRCRAELVVPAGAVGAIAGAR